MVETAAHLTHKALTGIDIAIIAVYFVVIFAIGFYFARKERTSADYFLASRDVGWFAIGASLFVSNISTEHFIGLAGSGATSGLAVGSFEWLACLILLLAGLGFRSVLPPLQRIHHAGVSGAPLQPVMRGLPGGEFPSWPTSSPRFQFIFMRRPSCWSAWSAGAR